MKLKKLERLSVSKVLKLRCYKRCLFNDKALFIEGFLLPTSKNLMGSKKKLYKVAKSSILYSTSKGEGPENKKKEKTR